MRRFLIILLCTLGMQIYAVEYALFATTGSVPASTMQSVNNSGYMSSGSTYTPAVYAVGASAPSHGPRKVGPPSITPDTPADVDPVNTNYGPVGDALIPLILMALAFAGVVYLRHRKQSQ